MTTSIIVVKIILTFIMLFATVYIVLLFANKIKPKQKYVWMALLALSISVFATTETTWKGMFSEGLTGLILALVITSSYWGPTLYKWYIAKFPKTENTSQELEE